jgi:DNA-binding transcriptional regulator YdaS (Cro superfamily)
VDTNKLLKHFKTQENLAKTITNEFGGKLSQQAVSKWFKSGRVPPVRAKQIEKITGGHFSRHELSDVFD